MDEASLNELLVRTIRRPHYLLYTPERSCTYFEKQHYRVLMARGEPLSNFLAPAALVDYEDERGRKVQQVRYDLSGCEGGVSIMDNLSGALVDEFEQAATALVTGGGVRLPEYELTLRAGFRLPDPDLEPNAYLMYGPEEGRRLIVLWGAEQKQNSSLPLVPIPGYDGPTILDRLRARVMGPAALRNQALRSLDRTRHPLSRFVGVASFAPGGALRELVSQGSRIPAAKLKRMKYLPQAEIDAFTQAARQYLEEARPDNAVTSAYEKELRLALRLPDPVLKPGAYLRNGKELVIACDPQDDYERGLHPVDDSVLGLPAPLEGGIAASTVADRLASRATPVKLYATLGGIGTLAVLGLALLIALLDHTAPALIDGKVQTIEAVSASAHRDTPNRIRLVFDEDIAPASLAPEGPNAVKTFYLSDPDGRPIEIERVDLHKNVIDLFLPQDKPMQDGGRYALELSNLSDTSLNHNVIASGTRIRFDYYDTVPPAILGDPSAEGSDSRKLRIEFSEALDKFGAENPGYYQIDDFQVVKAEYEPETHSVILTCERRGADLVDKGFADGGQYRVSVQNGISDASVKRNRPAEALTRSFKYVDSVPPRLTEARAEVQTALKLLFNEKLDPASVTPTAFTLSSKDEPVAIRAAKLMADGKTVELICAPLFNKREYTVEVRGIADLKTNAIPANKPGRDSFHFDGVEDKTPPTIASAAFLKDDPSSTRIVVRFSEDVDRASLKPEHFQVESFSRKLVVDRVEPAGLKSDEVLVVLKEGVNSGETVFVRATDIRDALGNNAPVLKSPTFIPSGVSPVSLPADLFPQNCNIDGPDTITLYFNDRLDPQSAQDPSHYFYSGAAKVDSVRFDSSKPSVVTLHLSAPAAEKGQTVNAHDLSLENDAPQKQAPVVFRL